MHQVLVCLVGSSGVPIVDVGQTRSCSVSFGGRTEITGANGSSWLHRCSFVGSLVGSTVAASSAACWLLRCGFDRQGGKRVWLLAPAGITGSLCQRASVGKPAANITGVYLVMSRSQALSIYVPAGICWQACSKHHRGISCDVEEPRVALGSHAASSKVA